MDGPRWKIAKEIGKKMLNLFGDTKVDDTGLPIAETELSDEQVLAEIRQIKSDLNDDLIILGHHYQQDDVIAFADVTGDSLLLAKEAKRLKARYIVFCGVHFMAETADILTEDYQQVVLPDLNAGCTMADMAGLDQVEGAWELFESYGINSITPITYINSAASLKSFVGQHGGAICTSSNARKVIEWAFSQSEKLLFFPDQHLGRNTCFQMGIAREEMVVYNPNLYRGGVSKEELKAAKVILWYGLCSVHQGFQVSDLERVRKEDPKATIIVHPECNFEVTQGADLAGSTSFIINEIEKAASGSSFAVGTEINLVNRLQKEHQDKKIFSLASHQCLCTTMYRVRPRWLLSSLRAIAEGSPINVIKVDPEVTKYSLDALNRMFEVS